MWTDAAGALHATAQLLPAAGSILRMSERVAKLYSLNSKQDSSDERVSTKRQHAQSRAP
jgi:hypothetical protein